MENMKYFTFNREDDNFDDILNDVTLKSLISTKISWTNHLLIGFNDGDDGTSSYITLKYGDDMITDIVPDRSPVMYKEYIPKGIEKYRPK